jgi:hypothetical protein
MRNGAIAILLISMPTYCVRPFARQREIACTHLVGRPSWVALTFQRDLACAQAPFGWPPCEPARVPFGSSCAAWPRTSQI